MAKTHRIKIKPSVEKLLCVNAGGRCEFEGSNKLLTVDKLTQKVQDSGNIAHVIAASDFGPRGESALSEEERSDIGNLMLLCYECHRRIDHEQAGQYPVEKLLSMKEAHEKRIKRVTSITQVLSTHLLLFSTPIQKKTSRILLDDAKDAVLVSTRYPEEGIFEIRGDELACDEDDPLFMERVDSLTRDKLGPFIKEAKSNTGQAVTSLSVFALGTIPALVNLGYHIGDIVNVDIYQKMRNQKWVWESETGNSISENFFKINAPQTHQSEIALNISLSGPISDDHIKKVIGEEISRYQITIDHPRRNYLQTKSQLEHFERIWNLFLTEMREQEIKKIHLFCATPCSIAVLIGKSIHRKLDPEFLIYDLRSSGDRYQLKWKVNEK